MKTSKAIVLVMAALALCASPALAQRNAGSRGGGSHSTSSSRGSSSYSAPSRSSSSSSSSRSYSAPSRSSSSSSSRNYSAPSRSSSSSAPSRSYRSSSPSRPTSAGVRSGERGVRSEGAPTTRQAPNVRSVRQAGTTAPRSGAVSAGSRNGNPGASRVGTGAPSRAAVGPRAGAAPQREVAPGSPRNAGVAPRGATPGPGDHYARAGRPGGYVPPAARPIHPAPYFHHPWHHRMVHCHPIFWEPLPPRPWYWPGFWLYCNSYWYDYHVTDVVVVRQYVQDTYKVDMVTYGISGDIMYAIVRDGGSTYLQVYDKDDHLLAEQKINRKYCNMVIDAENGGCWISKKHDKDPLLFIWADGQLLIYEED